MVSKNLWYLSLLLVSLYTLLPVLWFATLVGKTLPEVTVTYASVWIVGVYCCILISMGYSLGVSFPEETDDLDIKSFRNRIERRKQ